jgi:hypothetical protein
VTCPETAELMLLLDDELPEHRKRELEGHLASCPRCRSLVETQRKLESAWREGWSDPDEKAFDRMRSRLVHTVPWWRDQRTLLAVAAVFSVYLGVKIFYLDRTGTPMAQVAAREIAQEEETPWETCEVDVIADGITGDSDLSEQAVLEEQTEEFLDEGNEPGVQTADHEVQPVEELLNENISSAIDLQVAQIGDETGSGESSYGFDQPEAEEADAGTAGLVLSRDEADDLSQGQTITLAASPAETTEDGSIEYLGGSSGSGTGGGGSTVGGYAYGSISRTSSQEEAVGYSEDTVWEVQDAAACCESSVANSFEDHTVYAVLAGGELLYIQRHQWEDLFLMADSLATGETWVITVDSTGAVSGAGVPAGTVIAVPDHEYMNVPITIRSN